MIYRGIYFTFFCSLLGACSYPPPRPPLKPLPSSEKMEVRSIPAGASVKFSTKEQCTTPCIVIKPIQRDFSVSIEKEGYKSVTRKIQVLPYSAPIPGKRPSSPQFSPNPLIVQLEPAWEKE